MRCKARSLRWRRRRRKRSDDERWGTFGLAFCFLGCLCFPASLGAASPPDALIEISTGPSLLPNDIPLTQGLLSFHGESYLVTMKRQPTGACACDGAGKIYHLDSPSEIGGVYLSDDRGKVWRNQNRVEIEMNPAITSAKHSGALEIGYIGPTLPRQP